MGSSVRTPETMAVILEAIRRGGSFGMAAECAGISARAFYSWKAEDAEFASTIKKVRTECALIKLDKIASSEQWQAHAWWLERQFPEDFSLVQKIEQVLAKHGLIAKGIAAQLEDGGEEDAGRTGPVRSDR